MNDLPPIVKKPSESFVEMTEIVLPQHTNAIGSVFGGTIMAWVDIAAATCALRHCRIQVVTAALDALNFLGPVRLGWIVTLKAAINHTSRTSCEVGVKVTAENPLTGQYEHTASAYLTMVGVNAAGEPTTIPQISPITPEEKRRYSEAEKRRSHRLANRKNRVK